MVSRRLTDQQCRHRPLVVLLGATAVGKSAVGIRVAQQYGTEVLTADSRQVYRGMDIGTDKPPVEERQGVPHRLIDLVEPDEPFNAGRYRREAMREIDRLLNEGRLPLVVGGTGLYIRTLVRGLCEAPQANPEVRHELMRIAEERGDEALYAELVAADPVTAAKLHPRDSSKIIRALEVYRVAGVPLSQLQAEHAFQERPFTAFLVGIQRPKEALYRRIEARIDWQLAHGMIEETRRLLAHGYSRESGAMKGLGYRHLAAHLAGAYDEAEMVRRFKQDTRHFAKRQMTWFRKEPGIVWISAEEGWSTDELAAHVMEPIEQFLTTLNATSLSERSAGSEKEGVRG